MDINTLNKSKKEFTLTIAEVNELEFFLAAIRASNKKMPSVHHGVWLNRNEEIVHQAYRNVEYTKAKTDLIKGFQDIQFKYQEFATKKPSEQDPNREVPVMDDYGIYHISDPEKFEEYKKELTEYELGTKMSELANSMKVTISVYQMYDSEFKKLEIQHEAPINQRQYEGKEPMRRTNIELGLNVFSVAKESKLKKA